MFDELALRRAKAMLVRQRAGLLLQNCHRSVAYAAQQHMWAYQQGLVCGHGSSRQPRLQAEQAPVMSGSLSTMHSMCSWADGEGHCLMPIP